jgi:RIO-like serine/threonine protein kinase
MANYLVISEVRQKLIAEATKQDKTLEQLIKVIEQGWDTSYIPNDLNPYTIVYAMNCQYKMV